MSLVEEIDNNFLFNETGAWFAQPLSWEWLTGKCEVIKEEVKLLSWFHLRSYMFGGNK